MFPLEIHLRESYKCGDFGTGETICGNGSSFQGRVARVLLTLWRVFETNSGMYLFLFLQNILKRTTPGSRDEDTATKAFNELKKVIIIFNNHLDELPLLVRRGGNNHAGVCLLDHQRM